MSQLTLSDKIHFNSFQEKNGKDLASEIISLHSSNETKTKNLKILQSDIEAKFKYNIDIYNEFEDCDKEVKVVFEIFQKKIKKIPSLVQRAKNIEKEIDQLNKIFVSKD